MSTKKCPYCAEEINSEAIKCKHCGSSIFNTNSNGKKIVESDLNTYTKNKVKSSSSFNTKKILKIIGWIFAIWIGIAFWYISIPVLAIYFLNKKYKFRENYPKYISEFKINSKKYKKLIFYIVAGIVAIIILLISLPINVSANICASLIFISISALIIYFILRLTKTKLLKYGLAIIIVAINVLLFSTLIKAWITPKPVLALADYSNITNENQITLSGNVEPIYSQLTVDGKAVETNNGNFTYIKELNFGDNNVKFVAVNKMHSVEKELLIKREPSEDEKADFTIKYPNDKEVVKTPRVEVAGSVISDNIKLKINGENVEITNKNFVFSEELITGKNKFNIESINAKSGLTKTQEIYIVRELSEEEKVVAEKENEANYGEISEAENIERKIRNEIDECYSEIFIRDEDSPMSYSQKYSARNKCLDKTAKKYSMSVGEVAEVYIRRCNMLHVPPLDVLQ
jgi:hypothetical protein